MFQTFAVLFLWDAHCGDPLCGIEWIYLPHTLRKTITSITEIYTQLIQQGRSELHALDGCDPDIIYVPDTKENLDWLLAESSIVQMALADYQQQLSIRSPKRKLWTDICHLPLYAKQRCHSAPVVGLSIFTDGSGKSKKASMAWRDPVTGTWNTDTSVATQGSTQVISYNGCQCHVCSPCHPQ